MFKNRTMIKNKRTVCASIKHDFKIDKFYLFIVHNQINKIKGLYCIIGQ